MYKVKGVQQMKEEILRLFKTPGYSASSADLYSPSENSIYIHEDIFTLWQLVILVEDNMLILNAFVDKDNMAKAIEHRIDNVKECLEIVDSYIVLNNLSID